ncbi:hypothetical protein LMG27952_06924 [Paraburkholderia hiiakae]|uniref:dTDP-4-dehydrorhamnose reductase n=1 Tax=Paraburkholderia hiiakae TaxID=1081782 RepID=A0ABM8P958_9BURK|nr:SDR family oxidoreductase [Paraburkholderia hiiakae]CAD6559626.1 hypothetical protein LMG27952_06924 [Paraburkholderia hiiakae]
MPIVLVAGASGMLGYTLLRHLPANGDFEVHGTLRGAALPGGYPTPPGVRLHTGIDATDPQGLFALIERLKPDVVINCIGLIKQLEQAHRPAAAIAINALFPHQLAAQCSLSGSRLIHISTDCVFAGTQGSYRESDSCDADDLYGRTKRLGEVDYDGHLTLRTSLIGHELTSRVSLVDWFLSQTGMVRGFTSAIFSGLPTVEVARVLKMFILPRRDLQGLFHLSVNAIDKDRLLRLVAEAYGHDVPIMQTDTPKIDRSLDSTRLRDISGYRPPVWETLVADMHEDYLQGYADFRQPLRSTNETA